MTAVTDNRGAVIIVGGAGAIGRATAEAYLDRGSRVVVIDQAAYPGPSSPALSTVLADVTVDEDLTRARASIEQLGWEIGHLVSLAGGANMAEFGKLLDTEVTNLRASVELNLTSHVLLIRTFLPLLGFGTTNNGDDDEDHSVVLVSSINALRDYGLPAYSAAKAGMFGLVRALATELGAEGIRINLVAPGTVHSGARSQPKDFEALRRSTALGRLTAPEDVAAAVVALTHDLRAVTGQSVVVDCGQTVATPSWRSEVETSKEGQPAR
jgi:NAD(P)-dependent dehydrogenase (short-subunit alcohol dehydrogenase family)